MAVPFLPWSPAMSHPDNAPRFDDLEGLALGDIAALPHRKCCWNLQTTALAETARVKRTAGPARSRHRAALRGRCRGGTGCAGQDLRHRARRGRGRRGRCGPAEKNKVTWDQDRLAAMAERIRAAATIRPRVSRDRPYRVPERAFRRLARGPMREGFADPVAQRDHRQPLSSGSRLETGDARRRDRPSRQRRAGSPFGTRSPPPAAPLNAIPRRNPMGPSASSPPTNGISAAENKTSLAIFGPPGVGKTTLLKSLPAEETVCLDLEAGMKSVQDWRGWNLDPVCAASPNFRDLAVLIGGPDPAQHPKSWYGAEYLRLAAAAVSSAPASRTSSRRKRNRFRRLDHPTSRGRPWPMPASSPEAFLRADRQARCPRRPMGLLGLRGDSGAEAPPACPRQDGDLRGRAREGHRRVSARRRGSRRWRARRPAASCRASSTQVVSMQALRPRRQGRLDPRRDPPPSAASSAAPAIPGAFPPRTAPAASKTTEPPDLGALIAKIDGRAPAQTATPS